MNLDSRVYFKFTSVSFSDINFVEYQRISDAIGLLSKRRDHKTSEIWCSHICDLFRKILKENLRIFFKNRYIRIYEKLYESDSKVHNFLTSYIYCNICDFLVFISKNSFSICLYQNNHFKRYINKDTISKKHIKRKEIL